MYFIRQKHLISSWVLKWWMYDELHGECRWHTLPHLCPSHTMLLSHYISCHRPSKKGCTFQRRRLLIAFSCRCFLRVSFPRQKEECSETSFTCSPVQSSPTRGSASEWRGAGSADSPVGTLEKAITARV